jgi:RNA polymerase sigma factor (sigma-70 family)
MAHRPLNQPDQLHMVAPAERAALVRLCARLAGQAEAAEDLAQETLCEAWRQRHKLHDPAGRAQWLAAIARNVCRRWTRERGHEQGRLIALDDAPLEGSPAHEDAYADAGGVEIDLERAELADLLDRALALLPPVTRAVLIERYIRDAPLSEVAARLGLAEGAVAKRLERGKVTLRRVLLTDLGDEAATYGMAGGEADRWQETRIWCPNCGQHRLLGRFDHTTPEYALRCPACCREPGVHVAHTVEPLVLHGVTAFKPAYSRLLRHASGYYRRALADRTVPCAVCGRQASVHMGMPEYEPPWLRALPGAHVWCPTCGVLNDLTLRGLVLALPEGLRFWRDHPRIRTLPERAVEAGGRDAIVTSFHSVVDRAGLDVVSARDSFEVIGVYETAGR